MRCLKHLLYGRKWWRTRQGGRLKYFDLTMVQNIEMINVLISVRRKAYLDTLQLEILRSRMGWQKTKKIEPCWRKFGVCCPMLVWANSSGLRLLCMQVISLTVYHQLH